MKAHKLLNNLILVIFSSVVFAEESNITGDCKEIFTFLKNKNYEQNLKKCIVNVEGNVTDL